MPFDTSNPLKPWIVADPDSTLDYPLDLTAWLDEIADTLASVTTEAVGATVASATISGKRVIVWVTAITAGASVTVRFTTTGGRTDDRTMYFKAKER